MSHNCTSAVLPFEKRSNVSKDEKQVFFIHKLPGECLQPFFLNYIVFSFFNTHFGFIWGGGIKEQLAPTENIVSSRVL